MQEEEEAAIPQQKAELVDVLERETTNIKSKFATRTTAAASKNTAAQIPLLQNRHAHYDKCFGQARATKQIFIGQKICTGNLTLWVRELLY